MKKLHLKDKTQKMKNKMHLSVVVLICSLISSCGSTDLDYQNDFEKSQETWSNFKKSTDNSYKYTVVSSTWAGSSWETTLSVSNGSVNQRHFKYTVTNGLSGDISEGDLEWTENENEIGTHENGAEPLTLDEVYNKAQQDWLIKRKYTKTYFEVENNGLISTCGYVDKNCADDCFIGINIKSIEAL